VSRLALQLDAAAAVFWRDVLVFKTYRWRLVTENLGIVFSLALFYYLSRLVRVSAFESPDAYFAFVVVGLLVLQVLQSTFRLPGQIRQELVAGTFERVLVSPFGAVWGIVAFLLFPTLYALVLAALTLLTAALLFGLPVAWSTAALAAPVALLGCLCFAPLALGFAAATVRFKQAPGTAYVLAMISLVAGLYFPVALLPDWIEWASSVQPFTPAVDLLRHLLAGLPLQHSPWLDLAKLLGFAVLSIPIGVFLVNRAVESGRRLGVITEY
jgi:ABC-2 type transport system permease protein